MKKLLIVVLALDAEPWNSIQRDGQRGTWAADPGVPVLWLHGQSSGLARFLVRAATKVLPGAVAPAFHKIAGKWAASRSVRRVEDRVETGVPETYLMTNAKTVAAFRHILATSDFDYVLRTNSSTYVNVPMLQEYVQHLPGSAHYGGTTWLNDGLEYVTGTSMLLSRDMVEHAAYDPEWDYDRIDDVALGLSMRRLGVIPVAVPRVDAYTREELDALTPETVASTFIVRCRGVVDRAHDIAAMRRVHALYGRLVK